MSGGTPLAKREGLRGAVEMVEAKQAEVVVVAYFDRLVRSLVVQSEVVGRVEAAGGRVVAVDFGEISDRTAAQWISATTLGMVSEYYRRSIGERLGAAQALAVERGAVPWPNIPPGYRRGADGRLVADELAPVVVQAFRMRAEGEVIAEVRVFLAEAGVVRSYHGVMSMLRSRLYLGEIHFGGLVNLEAHEPIVDRDMWVAVQKVSVPRGRRPSSNRLLARLGVLRCGSCDARMVVASSHNSEYPVYRCPPTGDCENRMTVSARIVEGWVVEQVRVALASYEEGASAEQEARDAEAKVEQAQAALDSAIGAFGDWDEPAAVERLTELRAARDADRERVAHLGHLRHALTVNAARDWDSLTLDEHRALIRETLRVYVGPGRGASRLSAKLILEQPAGGAAEDQADA